ncbi:MAG: hypothetical protein RLY16_738 [Bacteroidota bacterium]|jgi:phosphate-selective porin
MLKRLFAVVALLPTFLVVRAHVLFDTTKPQSSKPIVKAAVGKGVQFSSADGLYTLTLNGRIQSLAEVRYSLQDKSAATDFLIRRCRLNIAGNFFNERFSYRVQLGFAQGDISAANSAAQNNLILRDAMLYFKAQNWLTIGFGQTKLPGNRQRQISSANLQLVERSIVNNNFTLDRDKGIWLYGSFPIGKSQFNPTFSISSGEGRITSAKNGKICLSGRIEWLPFGTFIDRGDFVEADVQQEPAPKLSLGLVYSKNNAATRTMGQLGEYLYNNETADIDYWGADLLFKYKGFSTESEFYHRKSSKGIIINNGNTALKNFVLSGTGFMLQSGIFIAKQDELAARFAIINPNEKIKLLASKQQEWVLGYSHYFTKHNLKIQTDLTYFKEGMQESLIYRLSGVVSF